MNKWIALPAAFIAAAALTLNVEAAPKTNAKANSPKTTKTTTKGPSTKGSSPTSKGPSTKSAGTTKAKGPKSTTTKTTTAKDHGSSKKSGSTTTTDWKPTNAVAEKLMTKPNQLAKLKAVLPAGTDINLATAGFKNFGQLNAAVNVSQNLGIDFADLKAAMTGTTLTGAKTNEPTKSLGQAIQQFKPGVDADAEATSATNQANREAGGQ
jgi:hypothetical protein